jgi:hypothetical protein
MGHRSCVWPVFAEQFAGNMGGEPKASGQTAGEY